MKTLEQKIILALHPECKTQEEALKKENDITRDSSGSFKIVDGYVVFPISLPRVMQALENIGAYVEYIAVVNNWLSIHSLKNKYYTHCCNWVLTDKNGKDINLDGQSEETREALSKLFNV